MQSLNLAFRFILELLVLVALFLWGLQLSGSLPLQLVAGLGAPALVMTVWGLFVAPKATRRLPDPARLVVELVIWSLGALAFTAVVGLIVGIMFGAAVAISLVLMFIWDQRGA
jgi:MFS superfamily sulfate permease-like transporter